jgi:hypothetical protein
MTIFKTKNVQQMKQNLLKRSIRARFLVLLLLVPLLTSGAYASEPEDLFGEGFEHWQVSVNQDGGVTNYDITCPEVNLPMENLQAYILQIMNYCREKNPSPSSVTIRFLYQDVTFGDISAPVSKGIGMESGLRAVASSFLNLSSCRLQSDGGGGVKAVILQLDVNNSTSASNYAKDIPFGASLDLS